MASVNKVILIGNLGRDPDLRYTPGGTAVANFTLATNEVWRDKDGNKQEHTEWHRVVAWGKLAEIIGEHLKKGKQVYVEGSLRSRTYKDKDGNEKTAVEIRADNLVMLGRQEGSPSEARAASDTAPPAYTPDDDIPF